MAILVFDERMRYHLQVLLLFIYFHVTRHGDTFKVVKRKRYQENNILGCKPPAQRHKGKKSEILASQFGQIASFFFLFSRVCVKSWVHLLSSQQGCLTRCAYYNSNGPGSDYLSTMWDRDESHLNFPSLLQ